MRPHESLDQDTPASHYQCSPRAYPARIPVPAYPGHFVVKKVTTGGTFRFQQKLLYIANTLVDQVIGLEETDDGVWAIYFNTVLLGTLDERDYIIRGDTPRVTSVTHVAGHLCYPSSRLLRVALHAPTTPP